jgi:hypothetical protein
MYLSFLIEIFKNISNLTKKMNNQIIIIYFFTQKLYQYRKEKEKICLRRFLAPIQDAGVVKLILLLALIFFGMCVRFAADWGPSEEVSLIM